MKQDKISRRKPEGNHGQVVIGQIQIFQTVQVTDERRQESLSVTVQVVFHKKVRKEKSCAEERVQGKLCFLDCSVMLT